RFRTVRGRAIEAIGNNDYVFFIKVVRGGAGKGYRSGVAQGIQGSSPGGVPIVTQGHFDLVAGSAELPNRIGPAVGQVQRGKYLSAVRLLFQPQVCIRYHVPVVKRASAIVV